MCEATEVVAHASPVYDNDRSLREGQVPRHLHLMGQPVGDAGEDREAPVVIKKKVELDGPFRLMIRGPVEKGQAQLDEAGIEAEELVFETELLLPRGDRPHLPEKLVKNRLIELPGSFAVRIGKGRTGRGILDAKMPELAEAACKAA